MPGSPCRNAAKSRDSRSSSVKLSDRPRLWNAGRSPNFATVFASRSGTDWYSSASMSAGIPAG